MAVVVCSGRRIAQRPDACDDLAPGVDRLAGGVDFNAAGVENAIVRVPPALFSEYYG